MQLYKLAIKQGFKEAESQIAQLTFDNSLYVNPVVAALYSKNFGYAAGRQTIVDRNYLYNFVQVLERECGKFLKPRSLVSFYFYRYPNAQYDENKEENITVAIQTDIGERDATIFAARHTCNGPVANKMTASINEFFAVRR